MVQDVVETCVPEMVNYCVSIIYHVAVALYCSHSLLALESYLVSFKSDLRLTEHVLQIFGFVCLRNGLVLWIYLKVVKS